MIGKFFRKTRKAMNYEELRSISIAVANNFGNDKGSILSTLARTEGETIEFIEYIDSDLLEVSNLSSVDEQLFSFRSKTLDMIERSYNVRPLIDKSFCDYDRKLLVEHFYSDKSYEDAIQSAITEAIYSQAGYTCYGILCEKLGDKDTAKWFQLYSDLYSEYTNKVNREIVCKEKSDDSFSSEISVVKGQVDLARASITGFG